MEGRENIAAYGQVPVAPVLVFMVLMQSLSCPTLMTLRLCRRSPTHNLLNKTHGCSNDLA